MNESGSHNVHSWRQLARGVVSFLAQLRVDDYDGFIGRLVFWCKYGENAWLKPAGLFSTNSDDTLALDRFERLIGTDLSYNNLCDLDRGLQTITHIAAGLEKNLLGHLPFIAIAVKHGNVCGAAIGSDATTVVNDAVAGDPRAIFGGTFMANFAMTDTLAQRLLWHGMPPSADKPRVLDLVVAPIFDDQAQDSLRRKKTEKCRLLANPALASLGLQSLDRQPRFRYVRGGFLRQPNYTMVPDLRALGIPEDCLPDFVLAKAVCDTSNSNTITLARNCMIIGNAAGQQDRYIAARLAIWRAEEAHHRCVGAVAASDSFFPFPDGLEALLDKKVVGVLASSGSINDKLTEACVADHEGARLYWAPDAEIRGFFGH